MPAPLPPTSGYTYAMEISADQTVPENTDGDSVFESVSLSKPASYYLENFLDVPPGGNIPEGEYQRSRGRWIPRRDGRVITIVGQSNGQARVDVTGNGVADQGDSLAMLGLTDPELSWLVDVYETGQELWRVPIQSFSPHDCNFPVRPISPPLIRTPSVPRCQQAGGNTQDSESNCSASGSRIEIQNQILTEDLGIVGTPFRIHYRSDRVSDFGAGRTLDIPLTRGDIPDSLKRVEVEVHVGGRVIAETFPAQPNLDHQVQWNGRDAYGRLMQGFTLAEVRVRFVFPMLFQLTARRSFFVDNFLASFGLVPKGDGRVFQVASGGPRAEISREQRYYFLEMFNPRDSTQMFPIAGWSLDAHHVYDPEANLLLMGNGRQRSAEFASSRIIETVAGSFTNDGGVGVESVGSTGDQVAPGDGGSALDAQLQRPHDVVADPEGGFYVAESYAHRVRYVAPGGTITTVAGGGTNQADGIQATNAQLEKPVDLALGPEGSLFIAEQAGHRIRRVDAHGIIQTFAGTGDAGFSGDFGAAVDAKLNQPSGVDVSSDGTVYVADKRNHRVRRIMTDGRIYTVAGDGTADFSGDGGSAVQARLASPLDVDLNGQGSLYIADASNDRIRRIDSSGDITTFVGGGSSSLRSGEDSRGVFLPEPKDVEAGPDGNVYFNSGSGIGAPAGSGRRVWKATADGRVVKVAGREVGGKLGLVCSLGDGGPAAQGKLDQVYGTAIDPNRDLLIADGNHGLIRRVTSTFPGVEADERVVASHSGDQTFVFNRSGRHLRTLDARTGITLFDFGYNTSGQLVSVTDRDGLVTTIERASDGTPQAIVSPFGQRTEFTVNDAGQLVSVSNPADEVRQMAYTPGGLLTGVTKPEGQTKEFSYDNFGRLERTEDPAGGFQEFERAVFDTGHVVTKTTAMGRTATYASEDLPSEDKRQVNRGFDDLPIDSERGKDGHDHTEVPDGTHIEVEHCPDPRFGMMTRNRGTQEIETPGGKLLHLERDRSVRVGDTMAVASSSDTYRMNGRTLVESYNGQSRTFERVTPEGRRTITKLNSKARVSSIKEGGLLATSFEYNSNGKMVQTTRGSRTTTQTYNSDGYLASITDPLGQTTSYEYDGAGRITTQTMPDGRSVEYQYDDNGNPRAVIPPGREAHVFRYTSRDEMEEYDPPQIPDGSTVTTWTYNLDGQLNQIDRPDLSTISFGYDDAGRLRGMSFPSDQYSYSYAPTSGNLTSIGASNAVDLSYQYDGSLPTKIQWNGSNVNAPVGFSYDDNFRVTEQSVNGITLANFNYDRDGLLTQAGAMTIDYRDDNELLVGTSIEGLSTEWTYNDFGEAVDRTTTFSGGVGSRPIYEADLHRDTSGRVRGISESVLGGSTRTRDFSFDPAGRLVRSVTNGGTVVRYEYDANGNRTARENPAGRVEATYDAQDRLTQYGDTTYSYNAAGQLEQKSGPSNSASYDYDALGNLREVTLNGDTSIEYQVDSRNRRVGKRVNGQFVQGFLYKDQINPVAELGPNGNIKALYVYGAKPNVPSYMVKPSGTYRIISDYMGSVRMVVNTSNGNVVQRMKYDAFGRVILNTNPGFQPFGFGGGLYDQQTGLVRFGARDYDPTVGRWTAKDPLLFGGGSSNLYGYALNDPVNEQDLFGLAVEICRRPLNVPGGEFLYNIDPDIPGNEYLNWEFSHHALKVTNHDDPKYEGSVGADFNKGEPADIDSEMKFGERYVCSEVQADVSEESVLEAARELRDRFKDNYHLTANNCQHFTDAVIERARRIENGSPEGSIQEPRTPNPNVRGTPIPSPEARP